MAHAAKEARFKGLTKACLSVETCKKENIYGYSSKGKQLYIKITIALWTLMANARKVCEAGFEVETKNGAKREQFSTFESNIDFEVRYMVDQKIKGASWITLPKGKYGNRELGFIVFLIVACDCFTPVSNFIIRKIPLKKTYKRDNLQLRMYNRLSRYNCA